jgi:hypothetical protein
VAVWKLQRWTPDTCDDPPCQILQLWDAEAPSLSRVHLVAGYDAVCAAHAAGVDETKVRWQNGQWFDKDAFVDQQREWFKWRSGQRSDEPVMPAPSGAPPPTEDVARTQAYGWAIEHNQRWNLTRGLARAEAAGLDVDRIVWWFTGIGDARVLHINTQAQLNTQQRSRLQAGADIQFGAGKLVVEG